MTNKSVIIEEEWIAFDIDKIKQLKEDYEGTIQIIRDSLPEINLNSRQQIMNFFEKTFRIELRSTQINEIKSCLKQFGEESEEYDIIMGIIYYFRMFYALKNYINYILDYHEGGVMRLRYYLGEWCFKNRQRLPYSKDITSCITQCSQPYILKEESTWAKSQR